MLLDQSELQIL